MQVSLKKVLIVGPIRYRPIPGIFLLLLLLENDNPDQPASCKKSSGQTGLLQMIILMDQPFENDHQDGTTS